MSNDWKAALVWQRKKVASVVGNAITLLVNEPPWKDVVGFNDFTGQIEKLKDPPWHEHDRPAGKLTGPWTDADTTRTRAWLTREWEDTDFTKSDVNEALRVVAEKRRFHPVRDFLEGAAAEYDGRPRADTWLVRLAGAKDMPLVRAQGAKWLISAVARVFEPGCQVDHVLVLRGPQDSRKSTALRALAVRDEWFHDEVQPTGKDGQIQLVSGVWIALDDEFAGLRGGNERRKKSFITRRTEKFRSPYDKWDQRHARQCVLAAAVNEETILTDPTGGRRYWIIDVQQFDVDALKKELRQLWAEAVHRYRAGEKWYLDDAKLVFAAAKVQDAARARDAWEEPVAKWLAKKPAGEGVTTHDVLRGCVFTLEERMAHSDDEMRDAELRIANVLRSLGWTKCEASRNRRGHLRGGVRVRMFFRDGACPKCSPRAGRQREEREKREEDGHPGHSLETKEENGCPPLDSTLDTPGQRATASGGAASAANQAASHSSTSARVITAPPHPRRRGPRQIVTTRGAR